MGRGLWIARDEGQPCGEAWAPLGGRNCSYMSGRAKGPVSVGTSKLLASETVLLQKQINFKTESCFFSQT